MKWFRSSACIILMLAMSVGLAACGENNDKTGDMVELTWFLPLSNQPDGELVMERVSEIAQEKIGARLNMQYIDVAAYTERMTMNMASGNSFDICFTGYVNPYVKAVDNGSYLALNELLEKEAPMLKASMPDYAWEIASLNGDIYAVPNLQGYAIPTSLYFFKDLTDKYSFDVNSIQSVEDVEPFLKTIKENEPNLFPYRVSYSTRMWTDGIYEEITSGLVVSCADSAGGAPEVLVLYDTPEYRRAISAMHDWYVKGYIRSDLLSAGSDIQDFNAGKYAVNQSGYLPGAEATAKQAMGRDVILKPITKPFINSTTGFAAMTAIGLNSKNPEKAIKMLELANTDKEVFNLLTLGIEDTHYTLNDENKFEVISGSGYRTPGGWLFGNQFNQILAVGQEDTVWEETKKLNLEAEKSPLLGFVLNTDPIKNEASQIAAIQTEYGAGSIIVNDFADYDEMMAKMKAAGFDKLKDEVQRQLNEFWETK